jgi:hypothetical protein
MTSLAGHLTRTGAAVGKPVTTAQKAFDELDNVHNRLQLT